MKSFHRVMVATDLTPASGPAFRAAVEMANDGAELIIVHAYQPPNLAQVETVAPAVYEEWDRSLRADVERKLRPLVEGARRGGADARALILSGPSSVTIAQAAKDNRADLLVMGTHGRKGVSRFFIGSVASRVISSAPCPVMTVRAQSGWAAHEKGGFHASRGVHDAEGGNRLGKRIR